jgi:hypothetical protein
LQELIHTEERNMKEYRSGFIPEILNDINDLIDLSNDLCYVKSEDKLSTLSINLSLLKEKITKEFIGDVD